MTDKLPKKKAPLVTRVLLILLCDVLVICFSSLSAIFVKYDLTLAIPDHFIDRMIFFAPVDIAAGIFLLWIFKLYSSVWEFAGADELINIMLAGVLAFSVKFFLMTVFDLEMPKGYYFLYGMFFVTGCAFTRFSYRFLRSVKKRRNICDKNVMIIGGGSAGQMLIREYLNTPGLRCKVVCIIDDNPEKTGRYIHGVKIAGGRETIAENAQKYEVDEIVMAMPSVSPKIRREILEICKQTECKLKILPGLYQLINSEVRIADLRKVEVEDLLGREPVRLDTGIEYITGKTVLVTGGGGSIGSELCRQLAANAPKRLIIIDIYENNAYEIQQELKRNHPKLDLAVLIASVRNADRINRIFAEYRPDIVFHAAAHKHVPLMEDSPNEAIKNNVFGTYETAMAAARHGVKRFILISTDKAVNPTNVMGASKRICEMIVQMMDRNYGTEFAAVRFGNVLGSNGSVIPLFRKQIEAGGPVTVTHCDIVRYFMTIPEAVSLVLEAGKLAKGGEIFVLDMGEPVKIIDLAKNMIRLSGYGEDEIGIKITGLRPGEKLYEELLMAEEGMQSTANSKIFIGTPIEYDEGKFRRHLAELRQAADNDAENIRDYIYKIIDTYKPEKEKTKAAVSARVGDMALSQS